MPASEPEPDPPAWRDEGVHIVAYAPSWPSRFEAEAVLLREAIGPWITGGVHHVGSTAVPGLAAKPVIDIQVGVRDLATSRPCIEVLATLEYLYAAYRPDVMHWFCKPDPARRTHHLHLVPTGSARFDDVLAFRDYLRSHPEDRAAYEMLKRRLAAAHADDREAYTDGKAHLVRAITARAREWRDGAH